MKTKLGEVREPWLIRKWMHRRGLRNKDIAREVGLHPSVVSATIHGANNNRKVLARFRDSGCPKDILALPKDLLKEEAA